MKLLNVELIVSEGKGNGTELPIIDTAVITSFLGLVVCLECGAKSMTLSKVKLPMKSIPTTTP